MKKLFILVVLFFISYTNNIRPIYAVDTIASSFLTHNDSPQDPRIVQLSSYLQTRKSPLVPFATTLITISDTFNLPWTLIPAIAGVESNFCRSIPYQSFNCWGWNNGSTRFTNYDIAIETVAKTLREKYVNRGLDTPEKMNRIYASSGAWAGNVRFFMRSIEYFKKHASDSTDELSFTL